MEKKNIESLRVLLIEKLKEYKKSNEKGHIKLNIDKQIFRQILFEDNQFAIPNNLWKLLDLSGVSFDGVKISYIDFTGSKGVVIDPQKVYDKNLFDTKLAGVEIKGSFDGVNIMKTDFTGYKGEVVMDPQKVYKKSLRGTKLANVEIKGLLDDVDVVGADFTGSNGAVMDPQKVYNKNLYVTKLANVEIIGSFDGVNVQQTNFTGSKGGVIDPQTVAYKNLYSTKLKDVEIKGSLKGVVLSWTNFTGSNGALMNFEEAEAAKEARAILTDVRIINYEEIENQITKAFGKQLKLS